MPGNLPRLSSRRAAPTFRGDGWNQTEVRHNTFYGLDGLLGDDGVPLIVRIQNHHIDVELTHSAALRMFALKPTLLTDDESAYVHVNRQPPPLAILP